jgi:hypothetical protein
VTHGVTFSIVGMSQTQPTADGQAGNAGKLQLLAAVGMANLLMARPFAAAPIPIATRFSFLKNIQADNDHKWQWGVEDKNEFLSDGGELKGVYFSEDVKKEKANGDFFKNLQLDTAEGDWEEIAGGKHSDTLALGIPPDKATRAKALADLKSVAQLLGTTGEPQFADVSQIWRYYVSAVEKKPANLGDAKIIEKSGYKIPFHLVDPYIRVGRYPTAGRGAKEGLVDDKYKEANYAHYVELK